MLACIKKSGTTKRERGGSVFVVKALYLFGFGSETFPTEDKLLINNAAEGVM